MSRRSLAYLVNRVVGRSGCERRCVDLVGPAPGNFGVIRSTGREWSRLGPVAFPRGFASNHVVDSIVNFSVIDRTGKVHALKGLEGQSVAEVFQQNTAILGGDCVAASPEGRGKIEAHVKVPSEWFEAIRADEGEDRNVLEELVGDTGLDGHSRLGSRVVLGKELEGMTVSVGGLYPWKSL